MMTAGQFCTRGVDTVTQVESVYVAARRMYDRKVGTLIVVDESSTPVGILTDRDLVVRVLAEARDPTLTVVGEVMSERIQTVNTDLPVEQALEIMRAGPFRRLPVIDRRSGELIGLLSVDDILNEVAAEFRQISALISRESPRSLSPAS